MWVVWSELDHVSIVSHCLLFFFAPLFFLLSSVPHFPVTASSSMREELLLKLSGSYPWKILTGPRRGCLKKTNFLAERRRREGNNERIFCKGSSFKRLIDAFPQLFSPLHVPIIQRRALVKFTFSKTTHLSHLYYFNEKRRRKTNKKKKMSSKIFERKKKVQRLPKRFGNKFVNFTTSIQLNWFESSKKDEPTFSNLSYKKKTWVEFLFWVE